MRKAFLSQSHCTSFFGFRAALRSNQVQSGPAKKILEYVPASNPTIIGKVKLRMESEPNTQSAEIVKSVVNEVKILRVSVSLIDKSV